MGEILYPIFLRELTLHHWIRDLLLHRRQVDRRRRHFDEELLAGITYYDQYTLQNSVPPNSTTNSFTAECPEKCAKESGDENPYAQIDELQSQMGDFAIEYTRRRDIIDGPRPRRSQSAKNIG